MLFVLTLIALALHRRLQEIRESADTPLRDFARVRKFFSHFSPAQFTRSHYLR